MPTYSYRCTACDHAFDIQQAFSDDSLTHCPACAGALRKVFNTIGVTFQGSGFYRTDSRAEAKKASESTGASSATKPSKETAASSGGASTSSAAAKPAASTKPAATST
jgi:putative FmdB family regulatory protein